MVSRAEKLRMTRFIAERLEDSEWYNIVEQDHEHLLVRRKPVVENPRSVYIIAHNRKRTQRETEGEIRRARSQGHHTCHVFYKDGALFHVRLAWRGNSKAEKSLKYYTKEQRDAMIHLRALEKKVLDAYFNDRMVYYQPETPRLEESLRTYRAGAVRLDYSHLEPGDPGYGFAENSDSLDWKLMDEAGVITADVAAAFGYRNPRAQIKPKE